MTMPPLSRAALRRTVSLGLAGALSLAAATGASAEDGIGGYLSSIFGGNAPAPQSASPQSAPQYASQHARRRATRYVPSDAADQAPRYASQYASRYAPRYAARYPSDHAATPSAAPAEYRHARVRPLIVRLRQAKSRLMMAQAPAKPGRVSIYEDRTLRRGDAVMTADGVRIFAGSSSWPYAAGDFVSLSQAKHVDRDTSKMLAQIDKVPRS